MSLVKKTNGNFPVWKSLFSDFLDTDRFFNDDFFSKEWVPAVNVKEGVGDYQLEMAAPGFNKEDFKVSVENHVLTISAEMKEEHESEEKNYTRKEFYQSSFRRSFTLPENAEGQNVSAEYKNGLLKLVVPKRKVEEKKGSKTISVS